MNGKKIQTFFKYFKQQSINWKKKYHFLKKNDLNILKIWIQINYELKIYTIYKRKNKKIQFINLKMSNDFFFRKKCQMKKKLWKMKKHVICTIQSINI